MRIPSGVTDQYLYFVAVDATDFSTRETGLSSFTVYRSRNGGAAAAYTTPTINEVSSANMPGVYELLLDEDMTIDSGDDSQEVALHITHAGMAPVTRTFELYRPKITAGQTLTVSGGSGNAAVQSIVSNAITAASIATDAITAAKIAANAIGASELASDAASEIATAVWAAVTRTLTANTNLNDPTAAAIADAVLDEALSGHTTAGTLGKAVADIESDATAILADTNELQTDNIPGTLATLATAAALATVDSNVDAILVDTAVIGAAGAGLTAIPWNSAWDAEVQSECADALTAYDPPTKAELDSGLAGLNDLDAAGVATAVWNAATATYGSAGSYGLLVETNLDAPVSGAGGGSDYSLMQSTTIATVTSQTEFTLTAGSSDDNAYVGATVVVTDQSTSTQKALGVVLEYVGSTKTVTLVADPNTFTMAAGDTVDILAGDGLNTVALIQSDVIGTNGAGLSDIPWNSAWDSEIPTTAAIADAVWEEDITDHSGTTDSTAEALSNAGSAGDPWATALPGAYGAGTAGQIVGDNLNAPVGDVDTVVDAIKAVTDNLPDSGALSSLATAAALAGLNDISEAEVNAQVDAALADYDGPTNAEMIAALAALGIPTAIENADALLNRDMSAVSDTNARTLLNAIRFLRNKYSIAGSTLTVTKEDDSTPAWTAALTTNASADPITGSDPS